MLGSEYPENQDSYTAGESPYLAAEVFNQLITILESTQRAMGQGLGDLTDLGNSTDDTFLKQFKKLFRVDFGVETFTSASGSSISTANQGTRELSVTFNTYGGSTVFSDATKIRVFVTENGGNVNSQTVDQFGGQGRDSGNVVDGTITTSGFDWRHDQTNYIGNIMWLAVQWED